MLVRKGAITRDINGNLWPEYKAKGYQPVIVEEPKVEEPKVEDPKVEDPKVEDPKVEDPKTKGEK